MHNSLFELRCQRRVQCCITETIEQTDTRVYIFHWYRRTFTTDNKSIYFIDIGEDLQLTRENRELYCRTTYTRAISAPRPFSYVVTHTDGSSFMRNMRQFQIFQVSRSARKRVALGGRSEVLMLIRPPSQRRSVVPPSCWVKIWLD
jgi:hypothetical protein